MGQAAYESVVQHMRYRSHRFVLNPATACCRGCPLVAVFWRPPAACLCNSLGDAGVCISLQLSACAEEPAQGIAKQSCAVPADAGDKRKWKVISETQAT